jgi:CheY-like chemotaxis protein
MTDMQTNNGLPLVLVAEDDDSNFKLINAIIGKQCNLLWAKNGEDIVTIYRENKGKARAILMDIKMPIATGIEATAVIRQEDTEIPIIMQTAYAFKADRDMAMKAGATDVLVKPISLKLLRQEMKKYIPELPW